MEKILFALGAVLLTASAAEAQQRQQHPNSMGGGDCAGSVWNCADTPNPLPQPNTVWVEELTWMELRGGRLAQRAFPRDGPAHLLPPCEL